MSDVVFGKISNEIEKKGLKIACAQINDYKNCIEILIIEHIVGNVSAVRIDGKVATYPGTITVYNLHGQVVATGRQEVGLSHLSQGIYIVQGRCDVSTSTIKVIVGS